MPVIIHSGMKEMMIRYSAPTRVMRVRISLMWSAVRLPGRMPGIKPPGGFIPGIRPGKRTADHINEILTRITLVGALYLIIISFIPEWMITGIHLNHLYGPIGAFFERLPTWVTNGLNVNFYFGGTSLLIV